jgi:iron(III) transport system permease protein
VRWLTAASLLVGAAFAAPFAWLAAQVLAKGASWSGATGPLIRTLVLAAAVTAAAVAVGWAQAWLLWRTDLPGRRWLRPLAPLPLVIPSFVGAAALLAAVAPGGLAERALRPLGVERLPDVHGFAGAFGVLVVLTTPYVYLPVAARLRELPPSLEETARLLGRRPWGVFGSVVVPQVLPAVSSGGLLVFLYVLSDFGAVALLRYDTLTRAIYSARLFDQPTSLTLSLVLGVAALVVVAGERAVNRRLSRVEAARARAPVVYPLGRWAGPGWVVAAGPVVAGLAVPVGVLAWWALRSPGGDGLGAALVRRAEDLARPAVHTGLVAVVTAVVAVVVVLPVAYAAARRGGRAAGLAGALVLAGFALPGLVLALALVFFALEAPGGTLLYQTLPLLVAAYVVHFGAQAIGPARAAFAAVPRRLVEAAALLGARPARRFTTVELPLLAPGLLAGAGLVLVSTMKELPATLLLAPIGFDTLATRIWNAAEDGFLGDMATASLVLVALTLVLLRPVQRAGARE